MEQGVNEVIVNELSIQLKNLGLIDECINDVKNALVDISKVYKEEQRNIDEAYQRGLDDAWEAAWKIMDIDDFSAMDAGLDTAFNLPVTEAIKRLKAYEEKQKADDEIKVGDEVCYIDKMRKDAGIVTWRRYDEIYIMWDDGSSSRNKVNDYRKTGRHFDIDKLLEAMNE